MIAEAFTNSINSVMNKRLEDEKQREFVVTAVLAAFEKVPKKPVADQAQRLEMLEGRLRLLVENVEISFVRGSLVVKVAGSSESLLKEFRRGTDWYLPWDKVDETLLAAILVDPASN